MAVVARISTGFRLHCDRTGTSVPGTYEQVPGIVDVTDNCEAPRSEKTKQASGGKREFLPSLRGPRTWEVTFRLDRADTTIATTTHAELWEDFVKGQVGVWKLDYPPNADGTYTGRRKREALGFISRYDMPHILGEVITGSMTIQITGAITDGTN